MPYPDRILSDDIISKQAIIHINLKNNSQMTQQNSVQKDTQMTRLIADLQKRVETLEDMLEAGKEVLTVEEAAKFMGMARSSLYKMTSDQTIPFYRPNGKMIFFEKSDILSWIRKNRVSSREEIEEEARLHMQKLSRETKNV